MIKKTFFNSNNNNKMSCSSQTFIQNLINPTKHLIYQPSKHTFLSPKAFLFICIFAVFSLCYLISFPRSTHCPECHTPLTRISTSARPEEKTNISHILFGIGGSANTWNERRGYVDLYWKPNVTRGYVWLDEKPSGPWSETSPPYKVSGDTARFKYTCWYGSRSAVRIARIVKESFELGLGNVRWFVMGDDDTIFFTDNLIDVLSRYDHEKMYYIGSNSESVEQDMMHSYTMAYGGAGFAISYPLAAELVKKLDGCIDWYADLYGSDQKIGGCMSELGVPLTTELGFHQLDIRRSPYGLLAAHPLAPLVSLHHLDYVDPLFPNMDRVASIQKLVTAYNSDPARSLQQTFCYDPNRAWSVSISWGYTVQLYPFLVTAKELSTPLQTFSAWTWSNGPFRFNTRNFGSDSCERPVIFYFDGVEELGNRSTLSRYVGARDEHVMRCERDNYKAAYLIKGFNVSAGFFDQQLWNQAPRRQCCELIDGSDQQDNNVVRVKIRGCYNWESVTTP